MDKKVIIDQFYTAFAQKDATKMTSFYHKDVSFTDPAFGTLYGNEAIAMWRMLIERGGSSLDIKHHNIHETDDRVTAHWIATYYYGKNKRKVINHIQASFVFEGDKIIQHQDQFNLWKWSRQALGFPGLLLGWTPFMRQKIQSQTKKLLHRYQNTKNQTD